MSPTLQMPPAAHDSDPTVRFDVGAARVNPALDVV
jgi:hypothetical protein